jgi:hypothetical protein
MKDLRKGCSESERAAHLELAARICNLRFDDSVPVVGEMNTLSALSPEAYFAVRLDCRSYFAQRQGYGHDRPVFQGSDAQHLEYCRELCEKLGISPDEVARADVLREFGQAVEIDAQNEVIQTTERQELRALVHVERQVKEVRVWSSHLTFGLTAQREIGFLEFHWPEIPEVVIREARRLTGMVSDGWRAPEQTVAAVESMQTGIIHTPAIGYFYDVHAAIRVIYRSLDPRIGRKPAYYFDRHGVPVRLRQTSELIREPSLPRRQRQSAPTDEHPCKCAGA